MTNERDTVEQKRSRIEGINRRSLRWAHATASAAWTIEANAQGDAMGLTRTEASIVRAPRSATHATTDGAQALACLEDESAGLYARIEELCEAETVRIAAELGARRVCARYDGGDGGWHVEDIHVTDWDGQTRCAVSYRRETPMMLSAEANEALAEDEGLDDNARQQRWICEGTLHENFSTIAEGHIERSPNGQWHNDDGGECRIVWEIESASEWTITEEIAARKITFATPSVRTIAHVRAGTRQRGTEPEAGVDTEMSETVVTHTKHTGIEVDKLVVESDDPETVCEQVREWLEGGELNDGDRIAIDLA